jgi:hypothetical protein
MAWCLIKSGDNFTFHFFTFSLERISWKKFGVKGGDNIFRHPCKEKFCRLGCNAMKSAECQPTFRRKIFLSLQGQRVNRAEYADFVFLSWCWFRAWPTLRPWWWRWQIPPKRLLTFKRLHAVVSQKAELFITTAVKPQILHMSKFYQSNKLEDAGSWKWR